MVAACVADRPDRVDRRARWVRLSVGSQTPVGSDRELGWHRQGGALPGQRRIRIHHRYCPGGRRRDDQLRVPGVPAAPAGRGRGRGRW